MKIEKISPSSYDTYSECEWKFFLQNVCGFVSESGAAATLGHIVHKVLEILGKLKLLNHNKESKYWDFEYLWNITYNHFQNERPEICQEIKPDKLKGICKGLIKLLDSDLSPITSNTIATEKYFKIPLERPVFLLDDGKRFFTLTGIIDRIDKLSDTAIMVVDYKTGTDVSYKTEGRPKIDSFILKQMIQPRIYHLAAKHMYPEMETFIITFHYLAASGPVSAIFLEEDIEETIEMIERQYLHIKNNSDPKRILGSKDGWRCKYLCDHFKNGNCETVWREKDQLGLDFVMDKYVVLNHGKRK